MIDKFGHMNFSLSVNICYLKSKIHSLQIVSSPGGIKNR
ncbi:hypothetical protein YPPY13_0392 [Yersinia pestis PY-13]|uniref:Uncharacterized protein n=2 Tax=Yersinia pestis TaxID=632 RepID=A0AAV3BKX9_YERPE|nr:hypothetical protein YPIP275_3194 [Yersinia pestis biovar Orientalis str. IP275]EDR49408.1 hypothetical protein YpB42003004_0474 [Yersinia pestis biovar Antiqua str. B42003004]EDR64642.1 hypothetical protein YpK1973002_3372 [Yersinia pestis biovar Mediaevalis str. K1973002]EFA48227.1 hypothetical protein YPD27_2501 [Yersinia pestis KIM D27]EIQ94455.1 hypothetical protein YPPY01_0318 [Yersinia pestis PY-01]EIQ95248.1 hypothetical protein YPPY02_0330 [Yersinia pestis PY-02]EIQ97662.1 hypothe